MYDIKADNPYPELVSFFVLFFLFLFFFSLSSFFFFLLFFSKNVRLSFHVHEMSKASQIAIMVCV